MSNKPVVYKQGHHEAVLRSHSWRTAQNSAAYLLSSLKPDMKILDVGCGPGTITIDLATLVPDGHVTGVENVPDPLGSARAAAAQRGVTNVDFAIGDIHALNFPDGTFDVVHAHQVIQHVGDPVHALKEMRRVTKPGGIVAFREADFSTQTWYPDVEGLKEWQELGLKVSRANGGEPDAGRRLHAWAREAGFDREKMTVTAGVWCFVTEEDRAWWSGMWADRVVAESFSNVAVGNGFATKEKLIELSQVWKKWGAEKDGWWVLVHGEILCRV